MEVLDLILFDLDGTLIDSNGVWREVDERFLSAHALCPTEEYLDMVGHSIFPIAAQYTKEYYTLDLTPQDIMDEWMSYARDAYLYHIPLKPGAREFLTRILARGETPVLVSACVPELGRAVLERHGLTDLFQRIVFAQELGLEKRDPRFFRQVLELLEVSPADCVLYDDAPDNCARAAEYGIPVIGILDPFFAGGEARMRQVCRRCVTDFRELLDEN